MDPGTGKIHFVDDEPAAKKAAKKRGLVPIMRDLTAKEHMEMQIQLYSPCGCGSGKKFKFCCKT
jgi:hypothetical protein